MILNNSFAQIQVQTLTRSNFLFSVQLWFSSVDWCLVFVIIYKDENQTKDEPQVHENFIQRPKSNFVICYSKCVIVVFHFHSVIFNSIDLEKFKNVFSDLHQF